MRSPEVAHFVFLVVCDLFLLLTSSLEKHHFYICLIINCL